MTGTRKELRLKNFDYSNPGAYFITACVQDRRCVFGDVAHGTMQLNDAGRAVLHAWQSLTARFPFVELDEFVVMPNHVHGILWIVSQELPDVGAPLAAPRFAVPATLNQGAASSSPTLGGVVRAFKSLSAIAVNKTLKQEGVSLWQRNYYEHVIRNENELSQVREYIANNPLQWALDRENPAAMGRVTSPEFIAIFGKELP